MLVVASEVALNPLFMAFGMICVLDTTMSSCPVVSGVLLDLTIWQSTANTSKESSREK